MAVVLWFRSSKKVLMGVVLAFMAVSLLIFMPESWHERMGTINTYEQDGSAMGRINAWIMAWNLACDRWIGGGFELAQPEAFAPASGHEGTTPNELDFPLLIDQVELVAKQAHIAVDPRDPGRAPAMTAPYPWLEEAWRELARLVQRRDHREDGRRRNLGRVPGFEGILRLGHRQVQRLGSGHNRSNQQHLFHTEIRPPLA